MSKETPIEKRRKIIDSLDGKILSLLNERSSVAIEIGRIKEKNGEDVFSSSREREILTRILDKNKGPLPGDAVEEILMMTPDLCSLIIGRTCLQVKNTLFRLTSINRNQFFSLKSMIPASPSEIPTLL